MNLPAIAATQALTVVQQKEWGEIISGWETSNRYEIRMPDGSPAMYAGEISSGVGGFLSRSFLKSKRPFLIEVRDAMGQPVLSVRRPFTFFFSRAEIVDGVGQPLGRIQQRFAFFARRYTIYNAAGAEVGELHGPFFRPWTFKIMAGGHEAGKIAKQWGGLLKEAFTDADTFGVEFSPALPPDLRLLCVGATFLIDFVHFEQH